MDVTPSAAGKTLQRLGFRWYHTLQRWNYEYELYASISETPAGTVQSYELTNSHADDTLLARLEANAENSSVIYDIGAYAGTYSLALASEHPDRMVVAFEPSPIQCARFQQNLALTAPCGEVTLHQLGVGETDTRRRFYHSSFPKLSSFDQADATRWGATITDSESVPIRRLDTLVGELPPPDHIKIDVEGHAPSVLRGGMAVIDDAQPVLYIEPHDRPGTNRSEWIQSWCADHGYACIQHGETLVCVPPAMDIDEIARVPH